MNESLQSVSQAYAAAESLRVSDLVVSYEDVSRYSAALCKLESARDEGSLGLSSRYVDGLKAFYWTLLSNLLPYAALSSAVLSGSEAIILALEAESKRNYQLAQACAIVVACLQTFKENIGNPLANVLADEITTSPVKGIKCIVLADYRHLEATRDFIKQDASFVGCEVLAPSYLRELHFYDEIYLVGSPRRFERDRWLLTSPRAPCIVSVRFSWLSGFQQWQTPFLQRPANYSSNASAAPGCVPAVVIKGTVEIPDINWTEAERLSEVEIQRDLEQGQEDTVSAKLHALAGGHFVFLSTDVDAKVLSLELDRLGVDDENEGVAHRIKIISLVPGDYIVLRTEGGKDAVVERANAILGRTSDSLRKGLDGWKTALRQLLSEFGASEIGRRLQQNGSKTSAKTNVKNWCSRETIKPQSLEDFLSIMRVIGRETDAVREWTNAERVLSAHSEAGHLIRKDLIFAVQKAELSPLKETGVQLFELAGSGSLTAYRVENIAPNVNPVPATSLNRVLRLSAS